MKELQELAQVITGHGLFKHHMRHWNEIDDYQCALCGEADEDSWHIWEWCPKLQQERTNIRTLMERGLTFEKGILRMMRSKDIIELRARNEALLAV